MNPPPDHSHDPAWRQMLAYLDGSLPADEVRTLNERLKRDTELRSEFAALLLRETKLKELGEEAAVAAQDAATEVETPDNVVALVTAMGDEPACSAIESPRPVRSFSRRRIGLAAAAALALLGVTAWFWQRPVVIAQIGAVEGRLVIERSGSELPANTGDSLRVGDRLVTAPNSRATFLYLAEATEVTLEAGTELQLNGDGRSKLLRLDRGTFEATVAKQEPGTPLRLVTRHTEAEVVGTRFKLLATDAATRLEVFEGAISVESNRDEASLMVNAGHGVVVTPGQPAVLQRLAGARGTLFLETWDGDASLTNRTYLSQFMFSGVGVKPGSSRARGFLYPPRSGAYSFHVTGSGRTELWLSDSDDPAGARLIWGSDDSDAKSPVAQLRSDQSYYIELRCSSAEEPAAFTLSWTTPGGQQRVIHGDHLVPFDPAPLVP